MENTKNEQVIYLKDLVFVALRQWRKILIVAVIGALVAGVYAGISGWNSLKDVEAQEYDLAHQQLLQESHEIKKESLEQQISTLEDGIAHQYTYLEESVLMQLDPYAYYEGYLSLYMDTGYQILPGMDYQNPDKTSQVVANYDIILKGEESLQTLAGEMGIEEKYLLELITTENPSQNRSMLNIQVKCPDQESAEKLLDILFQQIEAAQERVSKAVTEHEIVVIEQYVRQQIDTNLSKLQQGEVDRLIELMNSLDAVQQEKKELELPMIQTVSVSSVLKKAVVITVLGGVLGAFAVAGVAWVMHIAGGKVYSARMLQSWTGVKVLGSVPAPEPNNRIDRWLRKLERKESCDPAEKIKLIALNTASFVADTKRVLITGSVDTEYSSLLADALRQTAPNTEVVMSGNILCSADAIKALMQTDAVVLVETCNVSRYDEVASKAKLIGDHGKSIVGCVLFNS